LHVTLAYTRYPRFPTHPSPPQPLSHLLAAAAFGSKLLISLTTSSSDLLASNLSFNSIATLNTRVMFTFSLATSHLHLRLLCDALGRALGRTLDAFLLALDLGSEFGLRGSGFCELVLITDFGLDSDGAAAATLDHLFLVVDFGASILGVLPLLHRRFALGRSACRKHLLLFTLTLTTANTILIAITIFRLDNSSLRLGGRLGRTLVLLGSWGCFRFGGRDRSGAIGGTGETVVFGEFGELFLDAGDGVGGGFVVGVAD